MPSRGVHFAIDVPVARRLLEVSGKDKAVEAIVEEIERAWDVEHLAQSDKAWDAIHRCLTDGRLLHENGTYPLNRCILGGRQLYRGDDHIASFVSADEVRDVAAALEGVSEDWFREQYRALVPRDYSPNYGDEDCEYTWSWFEGVRALFVRAAAEGRAVLFTVDA